MKTKYVDIVQFSKWNTRLLRILWALLILLTFTELAGVLVYTHFGVDGVKGEWLPYLVSRMLLPTGTYLLLVLCAQFIFKNKIRCLPLRTQARYILTVIVLVASVVVVAHHRVPVVYALYVVPIALATVYVDARTLRYALLCSGAGYGISHFGIIRNLPDYVAPYHSHMDAVAMASMLLCFWMVARLMIERIGEIIETAVALNAKRENLTHEIKLDAFTQLYNHATFDDKLEQAILDYKTSGRIFSIIVMDLDDFKKINDTYGHDVGDKVILRLVDTINRFREKYPAFRYGGEEFVLMVPLSAKSASELADTIRARFSQRRISELGKRRVTVSMGVCQYNATYGSRTEFFARADQALYEAKRQGKNRVVCAREESDGLCPQAGGAVAGAEF